MPNALVDNRKIEELQAKLAEAHSKLDEFRATNIGQAKKITELEAKLKTFDGVDLAAAGAALDTVAKFDGLDPDAAKAALEKVATLESQDGETAKKLAEVSAQLAATRLRVEVTATARAQGFRDESFDYLVQRAQQAGYAVGDDGKVAPGTNGLDLTAWLQDPSFRWCHHPSRGGGSFTAASGPVADARPVVNAGDPESFGKHLESIARGDTRVVN